MAGLPRLCPQLMLTQRQREQALTYSSCLPLRRISWPQIPLSLPWSQCSQIPLAEGAGAAKAGMNWEMTLPRAHPSQVLGGSWRCGSQGRPPAPGVLGDWQA